MIRDAETKDIKGREDTNLEAAERVRAGKEQFTFTLENNPNILGGLDWFKGAVSKWNDESIRATTKQNRLEHGDSWALQRDINYALSDRKRLYDIGMDGRFEKSYFPGYKAELVKIQPEFPEPKPPTKEGEE
jgi:hypothetical protein